MSNIISLTILISIVKVQTNYINSNDNNVKYPSDLLHEQTIDVDNLKNVQLFSAFQSSTNKYNTKVNCDYHSPVPCDDQRNMMIHRYAISAVTSQISRDNILQNFVNPFPQMSMFQVLPSFRVGNYFSNTENPLWFSRETDVPIATTIKYSRAGRHFRSKKAKGLLKSQKVQRNRMWIRQKSSRKNKNALAKRNENIDHLIGSDDIQDELRMN